MLFDTHAHLDDRRFDLDREELLSALRAAVEVPVVDVREV